MRYMINGMKLKKDTYKKKRKIGMINKDDFAKLELKFKKLMKL